MRRGSKKPGKYEPLRSFGMRSSTVPARVCQSRSPLRCAMRSPLFSPKAAPVRAPTSSSISRSAAKPIMSRNTSASALFSTRTRRLIISSVIGGSLGSGWCSQPDPSRQPPVATPAKTPCRYSAVEGARQGVSATVQLHHQPGHDRSAGLAMAGSRPWTNPLAREGRMEG